MKKLVTLLIVFLLVFTWANVSLAEVETSRVRLLLHGKFDLPGEQPIQLRGHFIPGPDLNIGIAPIGYLGVGFKPVNWLDVEPAIGYHFQANETIYSLRLRPQYKQTYVWLDYEYRPDSQSAYWFAQAEYIVQPWLQIGLEEESWGTYQDWSQFSHGWGPNILLRLNNYGVDMAWHQRQVGEEGDLYQEFFLRIHLYF